MSMDYKEEDEKHTEANKEALSYCSVLFFHIHPRLGPPAGRTKQIFENCCRLIILQAVHVLPDSQPIVNKREMTIQIYKHY